MELIKEINVSRKTTLEISSLCEHYEKMGYKVCLQEYDDFEEILIQEVYG